MLNHYREKSHPLIPRSPVPGKAELPRPRWLNA
jgi:hypothetical protein